MVHYPSRSEVVLTITIFDMILLLAKLICNNYIEMYNKVTSVKNFWFLILISGIPKKAFSYILNVFLNKQIRNIRIG